MCQTSSEVIAWDEAIISSLALLHFRHGNGIIFSIKLKSQVSS